MTALLEVCVADAYSLEAAIEGGADRIELCSALELGGLTPSSGLMRLAAQAPIPVYAMVRPRAGDFVFSVREGELMLADIEAVGGAELAGVVLGASLPDGRLDEALLTRLRGQARELGSTLHRAFDLVPDRHAALETAIALGFERILTSGGALTASAGLDELVRLHRAAGGRIGIMPGSGLTPANIAALLAALPVVEVHSSCSAAGEPWSADAIRLGFAVGGRRQTQVEMVRAFRAAMSSV
ncbi:copper homeostasis protein CutC [Labrys sp. (in: a-proteobacteria)]|uniref:copper homeostasis protein CutC n=1 Tax=Labrys sp. (in: a-proteobacteria) TaxID=1917972 RepID=UPI0039E2ED51